MDSKQLVAQLDNYKIYDLEQPRYQGAPTFPAHEPGFVLALHRRHEAGLESRTSASGLITMAEHSGTHIDALCHQAEELRLYGGLQVDAQIQTAKGFTQMGVETIAPIIKRGVLLDIPRFLKIDALEPETFVSAAQLDLVRRQEKIEINQGEIIFVRTGNGQFWADRQRYERGPGLATDASEWCAEFSPFAVGADNLAWDLPGFRDEKIGATLPGHVVLLVRRGILIIESLQLEELSRDQITEFCCVCLPLKMQGATGSPVRPIALV